MKELNKKLIEYINTTIQTIKNMRERIYQLEKELKDSKANEDYAIEQMNKYKKKLKESRKKKCTTN